MIKDILRERVKKLRKKMTKEEVAQKSDIICDRLFDSGILNNSKTVMVYFAAFNEVRTQKIIETLFKNGKCVVMPVTDKETKTIIPYYFNPDDTPTTGAYGIPEPLRKNQADINDIDAVIVPGVAFDRYGSRMGFGAGYYDRFLSDFKGIKIGICYSFQCKYDVPINEFDIPMNFIINEDGIYVI